MFTAKSKPTPKPLDMRFITVFFSCLVSVFSPISSHASEHNHDAFSAVMQVEVTNRATARMALGKIAAQESGSHELTFWHQYLQLEEITQTIYSPVLEELQLRPNTAIAWVKSTLSFVYYKICSSCFINSMASATRSYYSSLEEERPSIKETYSGFYSYVLAQERVQASAIAHAAAGNFTNASSLLKSFTECAQRIQVSAPAGADYSCSHEFLDD